METAPASPTARSMEQPGLPHLAGFTPPTPPSERISDVGQWLIIAETKRLRWGGDLRRYHIFKKLANSTHSPIHRAFTAADVELIPSPPAGQSALPFASAEFLAPDALKSARRLGVPTALDVHDDQLLQIRSLGFEMDPAHLAQIAESHDASLDAFRWHVANSEPFARLAGLERRRVILAPNGSDPSKVIPAPWPGGPAIGLVSGAAPGRGIELTIATARLLRADNPSIRLLLALAATGTDSEAYLARLQEECREDPWITFATAPYDELGTLLGSATVLCVPHPPSPYWDAVQPVKLFDSMAAGRPIATTPRTETAAVVERYRCGVVARGDSVDDFAAAIAPLLADPARAMALGAAARRAVERDFDWRVISGRLSNTLRFRTDRLFVPKWAATGIGKRVLGGRRPSWLGRSHLG